MVIRNGTTSRAGGGAREEHPAPGARATAGEHETDGIGAGVAAGPSHRQRAQNSRAQPLRHEFGQQSFADHVVRAEQKSDREPQQQQLRARTDQELHQGERRCEHHVVGEDPPPAESIRREPRDQCPGKQPRERGSAQKDRASPVPSRALVSRRLKAMPMIPSAKPSANTPPVPAAQTRT